MFLFMLFFVSVLVGCSSQSQTSRVNPVVSKAQLNREIMSSAGYKVVAFHSPQCPACQKLLKILEKSSSTLKQGRKPISYYSVDVLQIPTMIPIYHIAKLPLLVIYDGATKKGQQESSTLTQEFLVNNFIKKETGIPGANPNFAKTDTQALEATFADADQVGRQVSPLVSLSERLFARVYQEDTEDGINSQIPNIPELIV